MRILHRQLFEGNNMTNQTMAENSPELTQANFDMNMVIILAALLCALICALGLNSMVRCLLRCTNQRPGDVLRVNNGLNKSALRKIPIVVYSSSDDNKLENEVNINDIKNHAECPICLGEFMDGEKVRVLPKCNHGFHVKCIDIWLASHSSCPNCRQTLLDSGGCTPQPPAQEPHDGEGNEPHEVHVTVDGSSGRGAAVPQQPPLDGRASGAWWLI